jgi:hypothetical protein
MLVLQNEETHKIQSKPELTEFFQWNLEISLLVEQIKITYTLCLTKPGYFTNKYTALITPCTSTWRSWRPFLISITQKKLNIFVFFCDVFVGNTLIQQGKLSKSVECHFHTCPLSDYWYTFQWNTLKKMVVWYHA